MSHAASIPKYWARRMARKHHKIDVFRAICSFEQEAALKKGDTVSRPYRSDLVTKKHTRGSTFTAQTPSETEETLTVQESRILPFYIDDLDELQANYALRNEYADDSAVRLSNDIDGEILAEYDQAASTVDMADFGGTSGQGVTVSESNVKRLFTIAKRKLRKQNVVVSSGDLFAVLSPEVVQILEDMLANKESALGDSTSMNGHMGKYMGFEIYESNALACTKELALATTPTDGDTVVLVVGAATATFTFKTTLGSTAGNVLIGGSADVARANLVALINAPDTTTANGVALAAATSDELLKYATATNDNSANTASIEVRGQGTYTASETLTDTTDGFTAAKDIQHQLFGKKKAIDVVIQAMPNVKVKDVSNMTGANIVQWNLFGKKTFIDGTKELVDVRVRADAF